MKGDLTKGPVMGSMLLFALPMIAGNLLQQCYNIVDTLIVGRVMGSDALAAVGSSYTLMVFLTSIILGLCMGSGALFSIRFGQQDWDSLKESLFSSFVLIGSFSLFLTAVIYLLIDSVMTVMNIPPVVWISMRVYLVIIFCGLPATFLYNYFSSVLRAVGNSAAPLLFLAAAALLNIGLDLLFVLVFGLGIAGAAWATILSQYLSGIALALFSWAKFPELRPQKKHLLLRPQTLCTIGSFSLLTCLQQSVMNLGILMVQSLVNSFGTAVMAAFAAACKIDSFAYMPVQDFGNAFSTFVAQNYGAQNKERIRKGIRGAVITAALFCTAVSAAVWFFAKPLLSLFVDGQDPSIVTIGVQYLHIEGAFYIGIGFLFLLYGLYRAVARPGMSLVLTFISLGSRVALAHLLARIPLIGVTGIWLSVPIGWALADLFGFFYYKKHKDALLPR